MTNNDRIWIGTGIAALMLTILAAQMSVTIAQGITFVIGLILFIISGRYWGKSIEHG